MRTPLGSKFNSFFALLMKRVNSLWLFLIGWITVTHLLVKKTHEIGCTIFTLININKHYIGGRANDVLAAILKRYIFSHKSHFSDVNIFMFSYFEKVSFHFSHVTVFAIYLFIHLFIYHCSHFEMVNFYLIFSDL